MAAENPSSSLQQSAPKPRFNVLRRFATKAVPAAAATLALAACAEQTPGQSAAREAIPGLDPNSHSFCVEPSSDPVTQKFEADVTRLVGADNICNDSDGGSPDLKAASSYDSTDSSGRFLRIARVEKPGEFAHQQQLAKQSGFTQTEIDGHAAIYHDGDLVVQIGEDTLLDFTSGTYAESGAIQPGKDESALKEVAADVLPSFS